MATYNENGQLDYFANGTSATTAAKNDKAIVIEFHPATLDIQNPRVTFPAFVTGLSDSFSTDWASTSVFGRNDPIYSFKSTTRSISLSFQIVSSNIREAVLMLERIGLLTQYLYPGYKSLAGANALNLVRPPLIYMKFTNLVDDHSSPGNSGFKSGRGGEWSGNGLLGVIKSLVITPNFDSGVFDGPGKREMYPKLIDVSVEFGVLHQSPLGWDVEHMATARNTGRLTGFMGNKSYKVEELPNVFDQEGASFPYGSSYTDFENEWEHGSEYEGSKSKISDDLEWQAIEAAWAAEDAAAALAAGDYDTAAEIEDEELALELEVAMSDAPRWNESDDADDVAWASAEYTDEGWGYSESE
jgi:hypothetical protein